MVRMITMTLAGHYLRLNVTFTKLYLHVKLHVNGT